MKKIKNAVIAMALCAAMITGTTVAEAKALSSSTASKTCTIIKMVDGKVFRDMYYMHASGNYRYFLDISAEPGSNVHAVHILSLERWKIDIGGLELGDQAVGVFEKSGRVLIKVK